MRSTPRSPRTASTRARIITIFEVPAQTVANALPPRYHVLYRRP